MREMDMMAAESRNTTQMLIISLIHSLFIVSYGRIVTVSDSGMVHVELSVKDKLHPVCTAAQYVSISSGLLELNVAPKVNDHVLLLSPKDWGISIFTALKAVTGGTGYNVNACIAIPVGTMKGESVNTVNVTEDAVNITIGTAEEIPMDVTVTGATSVNAKTIDLNGGEDKDDNLVRYGQLNTILTKYFTDLKTSLTTTPITGQGSTQSWLNYPEIDLSKAKCTTLTTKSSDD